MSEFAIRDRPMTFDGIKEIIKLNIRYGMKLHKSGCFCDQCCKWRGFTNSFVSFAHDIGLPSLPRELNLKSTYQGFGHPNEHKLVRAMIDERREIVEKHSLKIVKDEDLV